MALNDGLRRVEVGQDAILLTGGCLVGEDVGCLVTFHAGMAGYPLEDDVDVTGPEKPEELPFSSKKSLSLDVRTSS